MSPLQINLFVELPKGTSYVYDVSTFLGFLDPHPPPLAWAGFKIKVKRIAHSIVHFDQWNKLISKM